MIDLRIRYRLTGDLSDEAYAAAQRTLSPEERARHDRFVFDRDRRDFAAAHALLHQMLTAAGVPESERAFVQGEHGKPSIAVGKGHPKRVGFNLAHTRGLVACATVTVNAAERLPDVGVDVEPIRVRDSGLDIAGRFFCPGEVNALNACALEERPGRFTELWTLKEAYIKAIGLGLSCPLHSFAFQYLGDDQVRFESPEGTAPGGWHFALFAPAEGYRLAFAVNAPASSLSPRVTSWNETGSELRPLRISR